MTVNFRITSSFSSVFHSILVMLSFRWFQYFFEFPRYSNKEQLFETDPSVPRMMNTAVTFLFQKLLWSQARSKYFTTIAMLSTCSATSSLDIIIFFLTMIKFTPLTWIEWYAWISKSLRIFSFLGTLEWSLFYNYRLCFVHALILLVLLTTVIWRNSENY